ncbi:MAG: carboxylating nicotinate-nucleotide diphosphorylase [Salibacteraceae bacterium]|jgi:nicotinate-nucleotide pyrophosphorylase (carboxylating)|nr:carboxylating nicotinate-nucleotide diphosphorylase [Salibacteraceae bacterium]MDP4764371.1 carboxylating nicotinate-nucleotide diphosphorylase [Salibacteraceae bacterium]MDP4964923.1 carboxylating nicotinate-nucleotide diphosphorylase [Salibacteraceae bacterium]
MGFDLTSFIKQALEEDIREGDHTSLATIAEDEWGTAVLKVKDDGVLAGIEVAKAIFNHFDPSLHFDQILKDGDHIKKGQEAFKVSGKIRSILSTERLVLNLMQRMSGVATTTAKYAQAIAHTKAKVLDTRKTTPLLRWFEKEAVKIGGGVNHRFGLYDMILIKDNHVDGAGSIAAALNRTHDYLTFINLDLRIELEVRNFEELQQALDHGSLDRIMLDNFSPADTKKAVELIAGRFEIESSGGITLETITAYAETGVDFVSVGALTHSVKSLDLSLKVIK